MIAKVLSIHLLLHLVLQLLCLGMVIEIECQDLSLKAMLAVSAPILFSRLVPRTIRVFTELKVVFVLNVASQATESETVLSQDLRVSRTVPQLSSVVQTNRVKPPVLLAGNAQIKFMLPVPARSRKFS